MSRFNMLSKEEKIMQTTSSWEFIVFCVMQSDPIAFVYMLASKDFAFVLVKKVAFTFSSTEKYKYTTHATAVRHCKQKGSILNWTKCSISYRKERANHREKNWKSDAKCMYWINPPNYCVISLRKISKNQFSIAIVIGTLHKLLTIFHHQLNSRARSKWYEWRKKKQLKWDTKTRTNG